MKMTQNMTHTMVHGFIALTQAHSLSVSAVPVHLFSCPAVSNASFIHLNENPEAFLLSLPANSQDQFMYSTPSRDENKQHAISGISNHPSSPSNTQIYCGQKNNLLTIKMEVDMLKAITVNSYLPVARIALS